jgi:hypothetical protein
MQQSSGGRPGGSGAALSQRDTKPLPDGQHVRIRQTICDGDAGGVDAPELGDLGAGGKPPMSRRILEGDANEAETTMVDYVDGGFVFGKETRWKCQKVAVRG